MKHPDEAEYLGVLKLVTAALAQQITQPVAVIFNGLEAMLMEGGTREMPGETLEDLQVIHRHAEALVRVARRFPLGDDCVIDCIKRFSQGACDHFEHCQRFLVGRLSGGGVKLRTPRLLVAAANLTRP